MINNYIQLYSWLFSFSIGFTYKILIDLYFYLFSKINYLLRIFLDFLFVLFISISVIYLYFKLNGNVFHYSYLLFWGVGYITSNKLNIVKYICKLTKKIKICIK